MFRLFFMAITYFLGSLFALAADRPNILVLIADDHASYVYGAYGNDKAKTPNLDRLAEQGVRFNRAFVNCPFCTASRQSLLTGKLPHSIGVTRLRTPLPEETTTLAEVFKGQGYRTAAIGKMHFNSNLKHGFDYRLDHREHREWLKENPPKPVPEGVEVLPQWKPFQDHARIWLNGMYVPYGAYDKDMAGTWFAQKAQEFLEEESVDPFFMFVSFYEPHSPFRFPIEYKDLYDPSTFKVPEVGPEDDWQIPAIFRDLTDEEIQKINASYYTSTAFMDKNIGLVLDTLENTGQADNTFVVYFGDHGYSLGHHGRIEKHTFYEESVHAPLVYRLPDQSRGGSTVDAMVEFIDIFPTLTEFAGVPNPEGIEGQSLLPLIKGESDQGRKYIFSEQTTTEEAMIRTDRYKYIYTSGKRERDDGYKTGLPLTGRERILFDMEKDPGEFHNLAIEPAYLPIVHELEGEMLRRIAATYPPERGAIPADLFGADALDWYLQVRGEK